ncbi:MAG: gamma-glutamyltransferase family protein [Clostridia bacterium]|nr:gamma-glutamyltransferase family protein [Clostridia bacterium]
MFPYPSRRHPVYAANGMVATSQPLAAQAGLSVLQAGGNAIDAAVATAAALTVLEPASNGIGGDAFAIVWTNGRLYGLNASGPAPRLLSIEALHRAGLSELPRYGWAPVTVPGAPAAWAALSARFGRIGLERALAPAVAYAERGYPVSPVLGAAWQRAYSVYEAQPERETFRAWFETFAPEGRPPRIGEVWRSPDHARTLQRIAETGAEAFYRGDLAERIDRASREQGGYLRKEDLESFRPEWVDPVHVRYRGYDVWELPPNGQGLVALMALNILDGFEFAARETVETYHLQIEAVKLAFADGLRYIADPRSMSVRVADLLSPGYAEERRRSIGAQALEPAPGRPPAGGTVYLCTADAEGNMVSYIQSNYMGFGSGVVVPGTGIALQNRGHNFSLDPTHDNALAPGKRPYHTIIPGFLTKDGQPVGPFGVMGGFMQPQGHVQLVSNLVDFHLNPQAALDAPRWQWIEGRAVEFEEGVPRHIVEALARRGHAARWALGSGGFGRGQVILRLPDGVLVGGSEPRADGQVAAW